MSTYSVIGDGVEAKVKDGKLYVRITNMAHGCLEQGGRINRVISQDYQGTLDDAKAKNECGISDIDRLIEADRHGGAHVCRRGSVIR